MAVLSLMYGDKKIRSFPIGMGDCIVLGRHPANDIVIDNLAVSFQHAKIESIGDEFLLIDLKSENGTFVNEQRVKSHWLTNGDVILVGKHQLKFADPKAQNRPAKMATSIIPTMQMDTEKFRELLRKKGLDLLHPVEGGQAPPPPRNCVPRAVLSFLSGSNKDLILGEKQIRIGKAVTADIRLRGIGVAPTAAVINRLEDGWHLQYVGGWKRIRVNNQPVHSPVRLNRLDVISLGSLKMQFILS
jgi:pSer/pThr/pTyr-binding forkhead associated (FHA) protein